MSYTLSPSILPPHFQYCSDFLYLLETKTTEFGPWTFMKEGELSLRYSTLSKKINNKTLVPFAKRWDTDMIACFDDKSRIFCFEDFAFIDEPHYLIYDDIWSWLHQVIEDMKKFSN